MNSGGMLGSGRSRFNVGRPTIPSGRHVHPMTGVNPNYPGSGPHVPSHIHHLPTTPTGRHSGTSAHSHGRTLHPAGNNGGMAVPYHTHPVNRGGGHSSMNGHHTNTHGHTYGQGGWHDSSGMATGHIHGTQSGGALWAPHSHTGGTPRGGRPGRRPAPGRSRGRTRRRRY